MVIISGSSGYKCPFSKKIEVCVCVCACAHARVCILSKLYFLTISTNKSAITMLISKNENFNYNRNAFQYIKILSYLHPSQKT